MLNRFERPSPDAVTNTMTMQLQDIAFRGWRKALPHRLPTEIRQQFNPYHASHVAKVQETYRRFAEYGGLVLGYDDDTPVPVAYALAANDVSGSRAAQWWKRHHQKDRVYAWIRHVCIDADYQGQGNFTPLMSEVLSSQFFENSQIPTAYIFEENEIAKRAFMKFGFEKTPAAQEPKIIPNYFGPAEPVVQYRYAADSVIAALHHGNS